MSTSILRFLQHISFFIIFYTSIVGSLCAIDNPHFYRATYFWQEPRFEESWLTTVDFYFGGGSSRTSHNKNGHKTSLLNLYGPQNMHDLGVNVPGLNPSNPLDQILIDLASTPNSPDFAQLQLNGRFQIIEGMIYFYQNLVNGFFLESHLPIRRLCINHLSYDDLSSPTDKNNPEWLAFLSNFPDILARYNLSFGRFERAGMGDISALVGWTCNYEETSYLDFIDVTGKVGVLCPTGARRSIRQVISLPLGYNGHWGIPITFDGSLGLWEWVTVGGHIGGIFFLDRTYQLRMKTAEQQNGFFSLGLGTAHVDHGTIWDISTYIKADHMVKGLSCLFGYTFTKQEPDCLQPTDTTLFSSAIVNTDELHKQWSMHTLHFMVEWDFTKTRCDVGPRLGFFYNLIVGGQRIFNTGIKTSYIGFDISWYY